MVVLDYIDKRILQHISEGVSSYQELAKECNVTRNTIYRRMSTLEKRGLTKRITRVTVNYEKLDMVTITVALNVLQKDQEEIIAKFKSNDKIKFLFKTYGTYNILLVVLCSRGEEGQIISQIKAIAEKYNILKMDVLIGFSFEKLDFTPFSNEPQLENQPDVDSVVIETLEQQIMIK